MTRAKKLNPEQIKEIRATYSGNHKSGYAGVAKKFGVSASCIRDVIKFNSAYTARY